MFDYKFSHKPTKEEPICLADIPVKAVVQIMYQDPLRSSTTAAAGQRIAHR